MNNVLKIKKGLIKIKISKILEENDIGAVDMISIMIRAMNVMISKLDIVNVNKMESFLENLELLDDFKNDIRLSIVFSMMVQNEILKK